MLILLCFDLVFDRKMWEFVPSNWFVDWRKRCQIFKPEDELVGFKFCLLLSAFYLRMTLLRRPRAGVFNLQVWCPKPFGCDLCNKKSGLDPLLGETVSSKKFEGCLRSKFASVLSLARSPAQWQTLLRARLFPEGRVGAWGPRAWELGIGHWELVIEN